MRIDISKIKGYDEMSSEDKVKALETFEFEVDYTGFVKKDLFDNAASEAADFKKKWKATLSEKEQLEIDEAEKRSTMEKELETLKNEKTMSDHKSRFIALGYDEKTATETAKALIEGDMEKVFSNQQKFIAEREKKIKSDLLEKTPRPPAGGNPSGDITREKYRAMTLDEKQTFAKNDPEAYKALFKEE